MTTANLNLRFRRNEDKYINQQTVKFSWNLGFWNCRQSLWKQQTDIHIKLTETPRIALHRVAWKLVVIGMLLQFFTESHSVVKHVYLLRYDYYYFICWLKKSILLKVTWYLLQFEYITQIRLNTSKQSC